MLNLDRQNLATNWSTYESMMKFDLATLYLVGVVCVFLAFAVFAAFYRPPRKDASRELKVDGEKVLAGVRHIGVGIALAGAAGLFFGENVVSATFSLITGLVLLVLGSYTDKLNVG